MPKKLTQQEFIDRATQVHNGKYDYSKAEYVNATTKVCIVCPEHGEFWQSPSNHLQGQGCKRCGELRNTDTKEQFIEKARNVHGDKYDYSKVEYVNGSTKVCIICPEHGEFWQTPLYHISSHIGCNKCRALSIKEFVEKAHQIHGDKYDYSRVEYVNNRTPIRIICKVHGEFLQTPNTHLNGCGCQICSNRDKVDNEKFIEKARKIHGNKYDYSKVEYKKSSEHIIIICPEHGEFLQTPNAHLNGQGCPVCGKNRLRDKFSLSTEEFIRRAREVHGDKYDYSKAKYVNNHTKVCIVCPEHGEFWQMASGHLNGRGCYKCGRETVKQGQSLTNDIFIKKARQVHGNRYDYSKVEYNGYDNYVTIICPEHGEFQQSPDSHLQGSGCQKCAHKESKQENELATFVKSLIGEDKVLTKVRKIFDNPLSEIDIYVPSLNIAIEYDGVRWHSERFGKNKYYHLNKTLKCGELDIKLIHIFEDEYFYNRRIVEDKIRHLLGCDNAKQKIMARKCAVTEINSSEARVFLNANHIQGFANSSVHLGCFNNGKLVGVMSFRHEEKKSNNWELTRFASDINMICSGVGGKLLKHFITVYNPDKIKTFADRRWTINPDDNLYTKLGFTLTKVLKPNYSYVIGNKRIHKFNMRKKHLLKRYDDKGIDDSMTETEMIEKLGFHKIWDCGLFRYEIFNKI